MTAYNQMEKCLSDIEKWMSHHRLKMNSAKTEFMVISSRQMVPTLSSVPLLINSTQVQPTNGAFKNLGTLMQSDASLDAHIASVTKNCYMHLHNIGRIKQYLNRETLETIMHSFVSAKFDYCNALFLGLPRDRLKKLQKIQNAAARMLTGTGLRDHMTPVLCDLHWLPVEQRVQFKVLLTVHKCIHHDHPSSSLADSIILDARPHRGQNMTLCIPFTRSSLVFERAFSVAGPRMWNHLPSSLRELTDTNDFKKQLKTHLFRECYFTVEH